MSYLLVEPKGNGVGNVEKGIDPSFSPPPLSSFPQK